jgi:hypothetical protein
MSAIEHRERFLTIARQWDAMADELEKASGHK